jgi:hypothetical protein
LAIFTVLAGGNPPLAILNITEKINRNPQFFGKPSLCPPPEAPVE